MGKLIEAADVYKAADQMQADVDGWIRAWNRAMPTEGWARKISKMFRFNQLYKLIKDIADAAPAVDAVKVTRCVDCKYYKQSNIPGDHYCQLSLCNARPDGYCSDAIPVVHCKDCEFFLSAGNVGECKKLCDVRRPDDCCGQGEHITKRGK